MARLRKIGIEEADEKKSAEVAGLRYFIPSGEGIRRRRVGKGFLYVDAANRPIRHGATIERIRSLAIPPAWTSVRISPQANSHVQAVGRDARGRKQYRYHPAYRKIRDVVKFHRMHAFGKALPRIRRVVEKDMTRSGLPKRKVLAAVVKLLENTFIRIGNEEYAEENGSYGLTTLRNGHVQILGEMLRFKFRGKSGQNHEISLEDVRLARIVRKCREIPGSSLFQYLDEEGAPQILDSGDVNDYLHEISGDEFTAKDFRTWGGTCLAIRFLLTKYADSPDGHEKATLLEVIKEVAAKLGNKPAACKKYYIHPAVMGCYTDGRLAEFASQFPTRNGKHTYEQILLSLLRSTHRKAKIAA